VGEPADASAEGSPQAALRREVLARRDALGPAARVWASAAIFGRIITLTEFRAAVTILGYCAFGSEPVTGFFLRTVLGAGKTLVLPRIDRATRALVLHRVDAPERQLRAGVWGIREPDASRCPPVDPAAVDFVLVPGVVFDREGGRIGYGGGYYDRLLAAWPGLPRVAAAFEAQLVDRVPRRAHDALVSRVATERAMYPG
jgi:5-formyltetrahydrofolate cyclo-ligase